MCFGILSPSIPKQDPGYDVTSLIDIGCSQSQRQATGAIADLRFEKGILHSIFEDWFQLILCNACGPNQASKRSVDTSHGLFLILNLPGKVSIEVSHSGNKDEAGMRQSKLNVLGSTTKNGASCCILLQWINHLHHWFHLFREPTHRGSLGCKPCQFERHEVTNKGKWRPVWPKVLAIQNKVPLSAHLEADRAR
jgi:hypothetical protein